MKKDFQFAPSCSMLGASRRQGPPVYSSSGSGTLSTRTKNLTNVIPRTIRLDALSGNPSGNGRRLLWGCRGVRDARCEVLQERPVLWPFVGPLDRSRRSCERQRSEAPKTTETRFEYSDGSHLARVGKPCALPKTSAGLQNSAEWVSQAYRRLRLDWIEKRPSGYGLSLPPAHQLPGLTQTSTP